MTIRAMRSNQAEVPNYTNFIFLTNRMDAVKIEEGDRRYNIAPRQEQKLENVYPEVVDGIDDIEKELHKFAALLKSFKVNKQLVRTPISNSAKAQMAQVTMSVMEEFFAAVRHGNLGFFMDILDIDLTNVLAGRRDYHRTTSRKAVDRRISVAAFRNTARAFTYCVRRINRRSYITARVSKKAARSGITKERKRTTLLAKRTPSNRRNYNVELDNEQLNEVTDKYFDDKDRKLLAVA